MDAHRSSPKPSIVLKDSFFDRRPREFSPMAPLSEPQSRRSSHSLTSEYDDTPVSPTFSTTGHQRMSSSSTTQSSSPVIADTPDYSSFAKKVAPALPDVVEHPLEREGPSQSEPPLGPASPSFDYASRWSHDIPVDRAELTSFYLESYCGRGPDFFSDSEAPPVPLSKRRRSGESSMRTLTDRFMTRLPSLSRRRHHKRTSGARSSEPCSGVTSPTSIRSRSNSRAGSLFRRSGVAAEEDAVDAAQTANGIGTIAEDEADDELGSSQLRDTDAESISGRSEEPVRVSTPLLPHLMEDEPALSSGDRNVQTSSVPPSDELATMRLSSPAMRPHAGGVMSPALSSQPSLSAMHRSQASAQTASSSDAPPSLSLEGSAEWSELLGHADFDLEPAPYLPEKCTQATCQQLVMDWEQAKKEFTKHLCHTGIHYGNSSKTFRLTQEKWEWLNSVWRQNYVRTRAVAIKNGEAVVSHWLCEPAPVLQIPSIGEKFPMIGDSGVVGPMEQAAPLPQPGVGRRPSTKQQFMRRIGSIRRRGRSSSAAS